MAMTTEKQHYRPTESQYKGVADEMYITYDRQQKTRGGNYAMYPKVKRIYIAGEVKVLLCPGSLVRLGHYFTFLRFGKLGPAT